MRARAQLNPLNLQEPKLRSMKTQIKSALQASAKNASLQTRLGSHLSFNRAILDMPGIFDTLASSPFNA